MSSDAPRVGLRCALRRLCWALERQAAAHWTHSQHVSDIEASVSGGIQSRVLQPGCGSGYTGTVADTEVCVHMAIRGSRCPLSRDTPFGSLIY